MKTLCSIALLAVCAVAAPLPLQAANAPAPPFKTDGAFFALSVPDLAASTAWYRDKLGLSVVMEVPSQNGIAVAVLEGGGLLVELVKHDQAQPPVGDRQLVHGVFKAGMIVKSFDRTLAELRQRGVEIAFGPYPANGGQRANVILRDNAGNLLQLFGD